ncbi:tetratricopeptide repeat protein [Nonomuraea sp. NPDC051191]|uniref:tetratricopeptide repeat protein n=1 Tax=Nonomuraea sp. NPDC051191 TaxID=3364372 RepID=UPI0037B08AA9
MHATYCFEAAFSGGDLTRQAFALSTLGTLDRLEGHHTTARGRLTRSMALFEQAGQRRGLGICHRQLGMLDEQQGRHQDAQAHLGQVHTLHQLLHQEDDSEPPYPLPR